MSRIASVLIACVSLAASLAAQQTAPKLDRNQRAALEAAVAAVDAAAVAPETADATWDIHLLRASDGSHYVAFAVAPPPSLTLAPDATLYVRLATRPDPQSVAVAERSAVMEWLKGMRSDPLVSQKRPGIAFGEMPVYGPGAIATRGPGAQSSDLRLLALERERARERKEAYERERKAALEGTGAARARDAIYPFEDFTLGPGATPDRTSIQRALTAGPGDYDLYIAWATPDAARRKTPVPIVKRTLRLPPASTTELAISSVILADELHTRETPYPPDQQSLHPYAIGAMEIVPARDNVFSTEEELRVVLQVINARPNVSGKPDVAISFRVLRQTASGEQSVGALNPQQYSEATLPPDFDLAKGHPIFAATAVPLKTLARGDYKLEIAVNDRIAGRGTTASATFRIVPTPRTLLATVSSGAPLRRDALLEPSILRDAAARLRSDAASPAFNAALDALRDARFADLLREDGSDAREQGARTMLRGIGLYALGDPRLAATVLRQAIQQMPATAIAQLFYGAARALENNDRDALAAWQLALDGGVPAALVTPLMIDANLRLGIVERAAELARSVPTGGGNDSAVVRARAATEIAVGREAEAITLLDSYLASHESDHDAAFVRLHALFAAIVNQRGPGTTAAGRERFTQLAAAYVETKGPHASRVTEWLEVMK